jgi:hypothetical protein
VNVGVIVGVLVGVPEGVKVQVIVGVLVIVNVQVIVGVLVGVVVLAPGVRVKVGVAVGAGVVGGLKGLVPQPKQNRAMERVKKTIIMVKRFFMMKPLITHPAARVTAPVLPCLAADSHPYMPE